MPRELDTEIAASVKRIQDLLPDPADQRIETISAMVKAGHLSLGLLIDVMIRLGLTRADILTRLKNLEQALTP